MPMLLLQVVSNRMQKTCVVAVHYALWVPKYKVYQKRVSRHQVGDLNHMDADPMLTSLLGPSTMDSMMHVGCMVWSTTPAMQSTFLAARPYRTLGVGTFQAHDESQTCVVGDIVRIQATR